MRFIALIIACVMLSSCAVKGPLKRPSEVKREKAAKAERAEEKARDGSF